MCAAGIADSIKIAREKIFLPQSHDTRGTADCLGGSPGIVTASESETTHRPNWHETFEKSNSALTSSKERAI
jgi:hypothetical protein